MGSIARNIAGRVLNALDRKDRVRGFRDFYFRDSWLRRVKNIVHVGANIGQEAPKYAERDLGVLWIEPIPSVFLDLTKNIEKFPKQRACQALVTDKSGKTVALNVSSNGAQSSSIFELAAHKEIWPDISYTGHIDLVSQTLDDILLADPRHYDGLVMDTQGSELLVLQGATGTLSRFKYIKSEAADFEIYKGAATDNDLISFLKPYGFQLARRDVFARKPNGKGECFDLLFERR